MMQGYSRMGPVTMAVALVAVLSAVAVAIPSEPPYLDTVSGEVALITARGIAEALAALLAALRFRRNASRSSYALAVGFGVLAAADIVFALLDPVTAVPAAELPFRVVGAGLLAAAALAPVQALVRRPHVSMVLAGVNVGVLAGWLLGGADAPASVLAGAVFVLLAAAGAAFIIRSRPRPEAVGRWLGAGLMPAALAQLDRLWGLGTPAWSQGLEVTSIAVLVVGSAVEVRRIHLRQTDEVLAAERRRLARELHDGIVQELAFIASQSQDLARSGNRRLEEIAASADRALGEARTLVGALKRGSGLPLSASIALQGQEFARRFGVTVRLALDEEVDVAPEKRQAVLRIVGEALSNAARHADAGKIEIVLGSSERGLRVAVRDDGRGFDPRREEVTQCGFGLQSMRERAQIVGGELELESAPGTGTTVVLAIP
jgi:signal transduction histidine kinase